jgi:hypothetical protein
VSVLGCSASGLPTDDLGQEPQRRPEHPEHPAEHQGQAGMGRDSMDHVPWAEILVPAETNPEEGTACHRTVQDQGQDPRRGPSLPYGEGSNRNLGRQAAGLADSEDPVHHRQDLGDLEGRQDPTGQERHLPAEAEPYPKFVSNFSA